MVLRLYYSSSRIQSRFHKLKLPPGLTSSVCWRDPSVSVWLENVASGHTWGWLVAQGSKSKLFKGNTEKYSATWRQVTTESEAVGRVENILFWKAKWWDYSKPTNGQLPDIHESQCRSWRYTAGMRVEGSKWIEVSFIDPRKWAESEILGIKIISLFRNRKQLLPGARGRRKREACRISVSQDEKFLEIC